MDVRIAVGVDIAFRAAERGRHLEQMNAGVGRDVTGPALGDLAVAGAVEQRRHPELQIETGGDEQIGVAQDRHEAGLGLHEMRIFVALGDGGDGAFVADDFPGDGSVRGKAGDDLHGGATACAGPAPRVAMASNAAMVIRIPSMWSVRLVLVRAHCPDGLE